MPTNHRLTSTLAEIDAANALDPRQRELVYAERMSDGLVRLYPDASEALCIAARGQHIRRWQIERSAYPLGRAGYNAWRAACRDHHGRLIAGIMGRHGYGDGEIARVVKIVRKEELKRDPESQALENVVGFVFVAHYLDEFVAAHPDYDEAKFADILRKTLRKMDPVGHAAVLALPLPDATRRLIGLAMA